MEEEEEKGLFFSYGFLFPFSLESMRKDFAQDFY